MRQPTLYLSHGGGPWPWIETTPPGAHDDLRASLGELLAQLPEEPKEILMISAHWMTPIFAIQRNVAPTMLYDYGGFPEHTYHVQYPAPGSLELADTVAGLLQGAGIDHVFDDQRGFDHGMFAPMAVIVPDAHIPVVQLSIRHDFDPLAHFAVGQTLAPLRDQGILIIGSGLSFHNLRAMGEAGRAPSAAFDAWLADTLVNHSATERDEALAHWEAAPSARAAHPMEDHLVPLFVAVGAAHDDAAKRIYHQDDFFGSITASSFAFG